MPPNPFRHVPVLVFLLLTALPVGAGLLYALLYSFGMAGPGGGPTLRYWQEALSSSEMSRSLLFSAWIAVASTLLALVPALAAALSGYFRSGILAGVIYAPLTLPAMAVAFLGFQVLGQSGLLARAGAGIGVISDPAQFPELIQDAWGTGIIISHALMAFPFFTLLLLQIVDSERIAELQKLSYTLGASPRQSLFRVSLPLLLRRITPSLALYVIFVMGSYEIPLLLGRESPQMASVLMIRKLTRYDLADRPEAYILACVYAALSFTALYFVLRSRKST